MNAESFRIRRKGDSFIKAGQGWNGLRRINEPGSFPDNRIVTAPEKEILTNALVILSDYKMKLFFGRYGFDLSENKFRRIVKRFTQMNWHADCGRSSILNAVSCGGEHGRHSRRF